MRNQAFEQAMDYVASRPRIGSEPGQRLVRRLLDRLGNPEKQMAFVHLAGTNGKGSTATMIATALTQAGYRTGLDISPAVEHFGERIQVDLRSAREEELTKVIGQVRTAAEAMEQAGEGVPAEFDIVTAAALVHFASAGVEIAVMETGLGGRLDPTNVIPPPKVAVLTSISMDHMHLLGDTPVKIAREKCGILKPGSRVVAYPEQPEGVMAEIRQACEERGIPLTVPDLSQFSVTESDGDGTRFFYKGSAWQTGIPGLHFAKNALCAIETLELLGHQGFPVSAEAVAKGLAMSGMVGRMERLHTAPDVFVDGGHNRDGADRLVQTLKQLAGGRRIIAVMGMFRDKEYAYCIPRIAEVCEKAYTVTLPGPRGVSAEEACGLARSVCPDVQAVPELETALRLALTEAEVEDLVICCGSFALVKQIRPICAEFFKTAPETDRN